MGGIKTIPPIKIHQNDLNLVNRHECYCTLFTHLKLNDFHFWPPKGPKNKCIFTHIEGSPLWILYEKSRRRKIFWNFLKKCSKNTQSTLILYHKMTIVRKEALYTLSYLMGLQKCQRSDVKSEKKSKLGIKTATSYHV